jgi:endonuclease/exonuclease/phosphatase family metal-dependent hydrolase
MLWCHYGLVVGLLLSVWAKYISPALFWLPAFFGLSFPYLFLLNIIFLIYWFAQLKPTFTFGLVGLLISLPTASRFFQVSIGTPQVEAKELKLTSYNCMLFDLYNWSKNKQSRAGILENLSQTDPDVLCLQEFYTSEEIGDFNNIDTIKKMLGTPYHHTAFTTTLRTYDHWGIATFSRYPIINEGKILFNTKSNNICIFSDIVVKNDTIRVYNIHLQSISFSWKDHKFYEKVLKSEGTDHQVANSKNILRRIKLAFVKRTQQVEMITTHMKTCRYKIILCGDFNDTAASYCYERLSDGLNDAFSARGNGFGRTYAGKWPQFRIDYILYDKALECTGYEKSAETFTDHYPITARFANIGL